MQVSGIVRPLRSANTSAMRGSFTHRLHKTSQQYSHQHHYQHSHYHNGRCGRQIRQSPFRMAGGLIGRRLAMTHQKIGLRFYNRPWRDNKFLDKNPQLKFYHSQLDAQWGRAPEPIRNLLRLFLGIYILHKILPWVGYNHFSFKRKDLRDGQFWTLITNNVSHRRLLHLIFNSLMLFVVGPMALHYCGGSVKKFYILFFGCGVGGTMFSMSNLGPNQAVLGSSPSIFGMMMFTTLHIPYQEVMFFGLFPMKLWQLMAGLLVIEVLSMGGRNYAYQKDPTSHESHVAGILGGVAFYYWLSKLTI